MYKKPTLCLHFILFDLQRFPPPKRLSFPPTAHAGLDTPTFLFFRFIVRRFRNLLFFFLFGKRVAHILWNGDKIKHNLNPPNRRGRNRQGNTRTQKSRKRWPACSSFLFRPLSTIRWRNTRISIQNNHLRSTSNRSCFRSGRCVRYHRRGNIQTRSQRKFLPRDTSLNLRACWAYRSNNTR